MDEKELEDLLEDLTFYFEYKGSEERSKRNKEKLLQLLVGVCNLQRQNCCSAFAKDEHMNLETIQEAPLPKIITDKVREVQNEK